jgi:hypothetical protein
MRLRPQDLDQTAGKALEVVHDTGGYLRSVIGEVPADLVGVLGGAWLHERHIRLRDRLRRRTEQILLERDVQEAIELSPNMAASLIGAQEESREELAELWARLLANAMDPNMNSVRQSFIDAVKRMDPLDAVVLGYIYERKIKMVFIGGYPERFSTETTETQNISRAISRRDDEVEISIGHLNEISLVDEHSSMVDGEANEKYIRRARWVNATGREFFRACYPEVMI